MQSQGLGAITAPPCWRDDVGKTKQLWWANRHRRAVREIKTDDALDRHPVRATAPPAAAAAALASSSAPMYRVVPRLNLNVGANDSDPSCQSLNARPATLTREGFEGQGQAQGPG